MPRVAQPPIPMKTNRAAAPALARRSVLAAAGVLPVCAVAQFRVEITGVGLTQLPIALPAFRGDDSAPTRVAAVVRADLERSGQFRAIESAAVSDETSRADASALRQRGADWQLAGSTTRLADGRYDLRYRLSDVVKVSDFGVQSLAVAASDLRLAAHRIADEVYLRVTGERGVFATRLAYVTRSGGRFNLWVADADGEGAQSALASVEPIISPSWAPGGAQLAYVSFESRKAVVYVHEVATGRRRAVANFRGSNSAPRWSPDGRTLALTLSLGGGSQIYLLDVAGGEPRRLMSSSAIDTEPVFAPDGRNIFFVSDRGGSPQIYEVGVGGGEARRVSFSGGYNISPAISPDGRTLAYISRVSGAFKLQVQDLTTGTVQGITATGADERPSFAPNGKLIVYATIDQGREALMTTTLDGKVKARLVGAAGDLREPDWGPFLGAPIAAVPR